MKEGISIFNIYQISPRFTKTHTETRKCNKNLLTQEQEQERTIYLREREKKMGRNGEGESVARTSSSSGNSNSNNTILRTRLDPFLIVCKGFSVITALTAVLCIAVNVLSAIRSFKDGSDVLSPSLSFEYSFCVCQRLIFFFF